MTEDIQPWCAKSITDYRNAFKLWMVSKLACTYVENTQCLNLSGGQNNGVLAIECSEVACGDGFNFKSCYDAF